MPSTEKPLTPTQERLLALNEARQLASSKRLLNKPYPLKDAFYSAQEMTEIKEGIATFIELFPFLLPAGLRAEIGLAASVEKAKRSENTENSDAGSIVWYPITMDHFTNQRLVNTYLRLETILDMIENLQELQRTRQTELKNLLLTTLAQALLTDGILI